MFKINISEKTGKTFHIESEAEAHIEKELHDKIPGSEIAESLNGYEFEITGASDKAGFPSLEIIEGIGLKKVLLSYEKGMKRRPKKEGTKKRSKNKPKGLRLRKTARGRVISQDIVQINLKILKEGAKKLSEIFPEQNKAKETKTEEQKPVEKKPEANKEVKKASETPKKTKKDVPQEKPKKENSA